MDHGGDGGEGNQRLGTAKIGRLGTQTHINKQVLPQAPSPTMTNFLRSSAAMVAGC
jgi:hypothetical protein